MTLRSAFRRTWGVYSAVVAIFLIDAGIAIMSVGHLIYLPESPRPATDALGARREYGQWIDQNGSLPRFRGKKLVIVGVQGDEKPQRPFRNDTFVFISAVANDGAVSHCVSGGSGAKGHDDKLAAANLARIGELLPKLPDDAGRLPPLGRRVLFRWLDGDHETSRVYDRANMSNVALEIIRLSGCCIRGFALEFLRQGKIDASSAGGCLCLSPDQKQILFLGASNSLQFWNYANHKCLHAIPTEPLQVERIDFSPDASLAVLSGSLWGKCVVVDARQLSASGAWNVIRRFGEPTSDGKRIGFSSPRFSPDGKYLAMQSNEPELQIYDVSTWKRVDCLPDIPQDTLQYFPAATGKLAVVRSKDGIVSLWDCERHAVLTKLAKNHRISEAAFSPDGSMVAVVTSNEGDWGDIRIRLWSTTTGELLHELRPFEQVVCEKAKYLFWSSDSDYLFAATKSHWFFNTENISVWNVKSGRHRGEFVGCSGVICGTAVCPETNQLIVGNHQGVIYFWDFAAVLKRLRAFERGFRSL